jgi:hypothetical protein
MPAIWVLGLFVLFYVLIMLFLWLLEMCLSLMLSRVAHDLDGCVPMFVHLTRRWTQRLIWVWRTLHVPSLRLRNIGSSLNFGWRRKSGEGVNSFLYLKNEMSMNAFRSSTLRFYRWFCDLIVLFVRSISWASARRSFHHYCRYHRIAAVDFGQRQIHSFWKQVLRQVCVSIHFRVISLRAVSFPIANLRMPFSSMFRLVIHFSLRGSCHMSLPWIPRQVLKRPSHPKRFVCKGSHSSFLNPWKSTM